MRNEMNIRELEAGTPSPSSPFPSSPCLFLSTSQPFLQSSPHLQSHRSNLSHHITCHPIPCHASTTGHATHLLPPLQLTLTHRVTHRLTHRCTHSSNRSLMLQPRSSSRSTFLARRCRCRRWWWHSGEFLGGADGGARGWSGRWSKGMG